MKRNVVRMTLGLAAVVAILVGMESQASAFGHRCRVRCCKPVCCEEVATCAKSCEKTCEAAPSCCEKSCEKTCCEKKSRCKRKARCCEATTCCEEAAPSCESSCDDGCCRRGLFKKHRKSSCCESSYDSGCTSGCSSCGEAVVESAPADAAPAPVEAPKAEETK